MVIDKLSSELDRLEKELEKHEVQCEERWKTNFQRLGDIEKAVERIESRVLTIGGAVIVFLAGLVVTVMQ
jgi:hypothetical protein